MKRNMKIVKNLRHFSSRKVVHPSPSIKFSSDFRIRLATKDDMAALKICNEKCLPENYSDDFYHEQITRWKDLTLICENKDRKLVGYALGHVEEEESSNHRQFSSAFNFTPPLADNSIFDTSRENITFNTNHSNINDGSDNSNVDNTISTVPNNDFFGHVFSVAVDPDFRGKDIGMELMHSLHSQFASSFSLQHVKLHCRVSLSTKYSFHRLSSFSIGTA